MSQINNLAYRV